MTTVSPQIKIPTSSLSNSPRNIKWAKDVTDNDMTRPPLVPSKRSASKIIDFSQVPSKPAPLITTFTPTFSAPRPSSEIEDDLILDEEPKNSPIPVMVQPSVSCDNDDCVQTVPVIPLPETQYISYPSPIEIPKTVFEPPPIQVVNTSQPIFEQRVQNEPAPTITTCRENPGPGSPYLVSSSLSYPGSPGSPSLPSAISPSRPISPVSKGASIEVMEKTPIEDIIRKNGYIPQSKLLIRIKEPNVLHGEYIKAINLLGNMVYIKLDIKDGYISVDNKDLVMSRGPEIAEISRSTRNLYRNNVYMLLHGIAIDCKQGICFLTNNSSGQIIEDDMIYPHITIQESQVPDSSLMALPVISLQELMRNPKGVLDNTELVSTMIINNAYETCGSDIRRYLDSLENLKIQSQRFREIHGSSVEELVKSTNSRKLQICRLIETNSFRDPVARQKHDVLLYNLQKRHELLVELMHTSREVSIISERLDLVSRQLNDINRHLSSNFQDVKSDLRP